MMISVLLFILVCAYGVGLWQLWAGVRKVIKDNRGEDVFSDEKGNWPTVSIIVAARNEEENLPKLLRCLMTLDYPADKIEYAIVDDRSTDSTWDLLQRAHRKWPNLKIIQIAEEIPGFAPKKRALDSAIRATQGEILLLTDADCTPPEGWAKAMVRHFKEDTAIVPGYSPYRFDTPVPRLLRGILALDFFSLATVAAGSVGMGQPITAVGCNLCYRRSTYFAVDGFEKIKEWISGDDDLFLQLVGESKVGNANYALHPESFVPGAAPVSFRQFWNQRIRYASKSLYYKWQFTFSLLALYLFNLSIPVSVLLLGVGKTGLALPGLVVWLIKMGADYLFLKRCTRVFQQEHLMRYFLPTSILHPFYVSLFGALGSLMGFSWKNDDDTKKKMSRPNVDA